VGAGSTGSANNSAKANPTASGTKFGMGRDIASEDIGLKCSDP
jgi:hypothetical protein